MHVVCRADFSTIVPDFWENTLVSNRVPLTPLLTLASCVQQRCQSNYLLQHSSRSLFCFIHFSTMVCNFVESFDWITYCIADQERYPQLLLFGSRWYGGTFTTFGCRVLKYCRRQPAAAFNLRASNTWWRPLSLEVAAVASSHLKIINS